VHRSPVEAFLLGESDAFLWELFHENSKTNRFELNPGARRRATDEEIVATMRRLRTAKAYRDRRATALPRDFPPASADLDEVMLERQTARGFGGAAIAVDALAKVLFMAYGITRDNAGTTFPRPFRTVPSGGALYPLELYVAATAVDGLAPDLYHYDPERHVLDRLERPEELHRLASAFVQAPLVEHAAAVVLITAIAVRATFKYGDRGYRFILLEAGHVAQNACLAAAGLGLAAAPIGGFFDREVDRLLAVDGVDESCIYALLLGSPTDEAGR